MSSKSVVPLKTTLATTSSEPWPKQRRTEIDIVARQLDRLVTYSAQLQEATRKNIRGKSLADIQNLLEMFGVSGLRRGMKELPARLEALEPAEWCDEDWNLQAPAVSKNAWSAASQHQICPMQACLRGSCWTM